MGWRDSIAEITHEQLVNRAFDWLKMTNGSKVIFKERVASTRETPDAMGFHRTASTVIECKVSRSDFLADKKKSFRNRPQDGMGYERYYMAPMGLLDVGEIPEGWGLIEVRKINKQKYWSVEIARPSERFFERNLSAEVDYLVSAIRRIQISMAVFIEQDGK